LHPARFVQTDRKGRLEIDDAATKNVEQSINSDSCA
jgi:hypothetical protein